MMSAAESIRHHWPTRDVQASRVALSRIFWRWRLRVGLKYHAQHAMLERVLGHTVELSEFDEIQREAL